MTFATHIVNEDCCSLCEKTMQVDTLGSRTVMFCGDPDCSEHGFVDVPRGFMREFQIPKEVLWKRTYTRID